MEQLITIVWDPSRGMFPFDIPILNRPILWYGFFFAFGFFLGYLCLTYLLRRYFLFSTKEEVTSWPSLILAASKLKFAEKKWCQEWKVGDAIPSEKRAEILHALENTSDGVELSSFHKRLLAYAAKMPCDLAILRRKLQLEQKLTGAIASIKQRTSQLAEQITFYVCVGAIVGARLGDVLFYQNWEEIARHPLSIIAVWEGGLSSHGGAVGILIALYLFAKKRKIPFWTAVDFTVIPVAIAAICIRIGNFFNQEILGVPTTLPWGVLFLHPADGGPIVPRHPAQLYEAIAYFCVAIILLGYWHRGLPFRKSGKMTGLFLILVFSFRFLVEFVKVEQSVHASSFLTMGQWLSIPFILLGTWLFFKRR
jgi:prolipoprotein diacylglyceryl transferase